MKKVLIKKRKFKQ